MNRHHKKSVGNAHGFTLVEALVALLALSIGLLGVAALQMTGLRNNLSASWRSQATYLAYDIVDRMRANRTNAIAYDIGCGAGPGAGVAGSDIDAWRQNIANTLPAGVGCMQVVTSPIDNTSTVTITVRWDDSRGTEAPLDFITRSII